MNVDQGQLRVLCLHDEYLCLDYNLRVINGTWAVYTFIKITTKHSLPSAKINYTMNIYYFQALNRVKFL